MNLKQKTAIRFDDYTVVEPNAEAIDRCVECALYRLDDRAIRSFSLGRALLTQIRYISPLFWLMQAAVCLLVVTLGVGENPQYRMILAALGPALTAITAPEMAKSHMYGMWELESSAMYSLARLTSIRLFIVGFVDLAVLGVAGFAFRGQTHLQPIDQIFLTGLPFLLTSLINFFVLDRMRGQFGAAVCAACALVVGIVCAALADTPPVILTNNLKFVALFIATGLCVLQAVRFVKHEGRISANAAYN